MKDKTRKVLNNIKWQELIEGFIDILHINIFIIDEYSNVIVPPLRNKYGERLLSDETLGFDLLIYKTNIMEQFKPNGFFFEAVNRFNLHSFALPIDIGNYTIGYLAIGPVILNKQLDALECQRLARSYGIETTDYIHELSELRVVSNIMINSILNILVREIKNTVELNLNQIRQEEELAQAAAEKTLKENISDVRTIPTRTPQNTDKLADMILSLAMNITGIECGSFMVADEKKETLRVSAFKGIDKTKIRDVKTKIGEGISGMAAKEGKAYHIKGQKGPNNRLRHLLQRPEIKQSLIMPINIKDALFGVLNLHTKKDNVRLVKNIDKLENITYLLSAV